MLGREVQQEVSAGTDKRSDDSLITIKSYEPSQVDGRSKNRRQRYNRRQEAQRREICHVRELAGLNPNTSDGFAKTSSRFWCGHARKFGSVSLKLTNRDGKNVAHFSGTEHCASVWACPVCAPIIRHERAQEITEGAKRHLAAGGGLAMATFTVQHARVDGLAELMRVLADAYSDMSRSRAFRAWKKERGFVGYVCAQEITYGRFGWHPHRHVLMFFDSPITADDEQVMASELFAMWQHAVKRVGGRTVSRDAFDVRAVKTGEEAVASYVTKLSKGVEGIGKEISLADLKSGRAAGSITPFQLLDVDTPEAERLWNEYADATKGKSAIRWSRGLRDTLGMAKERTDKEVMDELQRIGDTKAMIAPSLFNRRISRRYEIACSLLEAVERGDIDEAERIIGGRVYFVSTAVGLIPMFEERPAPIQSERLAA